MKKISSKYKFISLFFFCLFLTTVSWAAGAPLIQGVAGELSSGGTLVVTGSNFTRHKNYGGADNYLPYLWETFDDANPYVTNSKFTSGYSKLMSSENKVNSKNYLKHQRLDLAETYTTFLGESVKLSTMYNCKVNVAGLSARSEYFFSGWYMTQNINTLIDNTSNQIKTLDASPSNNNNKIYFNLEGYAGYPRYSMDIESYEKLYDGPVSTAAKDGTWHRFDVYVSVPVADNSYTDIVKFWIDGRLTGVSKQVGLLYSTVNDVLPIDSVYYVNWINNSSNSSFYILSDDVFIDFTQARVELSESSVWDDTVQVHKELQIPISWEDGNIQIKVNQGSMTNLSDKFLFVVDENGAVSNGFPLASLGVVKPLPPREPRLDGN